MTWQLVPLADAAPSLWKNGGGVTREIVAWPNAQDWVWRMSVADVVSDGPFSRFEGVQRWFAVLSGAGVRLEMGSQPVEQVHTLVSTCAPLCFDGAQPVYCTLIDGATRDFNLMLRRSHASAQMTRVEGEISAVTNNIKIIAIYAIDTRATVHFDDEVLNLPPYTLAWRSCTAGARLQVKATHALWMEITT